MLNGILVIISLVALGFGAQFALMRRVRSLGWRLTPLFAMIAIGIYALLRGIQIIEYPWDGRGFFNAGPLVGLVLLLCLIPIGVGVLAGLVTDRIMVSISKRKAGRGL